jgi:prophage antirepressor-like protein
MCATCAPTVTRGSRVSNDLITFNFAEGSEVRTVWRDGAAWFVAVDVCRILGIANSSQALRRLDDDEKGVWNAYTLPLISNDPKRDVAIVSESGLYALVLSSRKPAARKFRKWVTSEVLPALRTRGVYALPSSGLKFSLSSEGRALREQGRLNFLAKPLWERRKRLQYCGNRAFYRYEAYCRALETGEF